MYLTYPFVGKEVSIVFSVLCVVHLTLHTIQNYFVYSPLFPLVIISTQFLAVSLFSFLPSVCQGESDIYGNATTDSVLNWTMADGGSNETLTADVLPCHFPPLELMSTINGLILTTFGFYSLGSTVRILQMTLLSLTHLVLAWAFGFFQIFDAVNLSMFLVALIIHARETEATGRLDFLWKMQAKGTTFTF
jgi:hypothetical protein